MKKINEIRAEERQERGRLQKKLAEIISGDINKCGVNEIMVMNKNFAWRLKIKVDDLICVGRKRK